MITKAATVIPTISHIDHVFFPLSPWGVGEGAATSVCYSKFMNFSFNTKALESQLKMK
jgi:hypothetical protein